MTDKKKHRRVRWKVRRCPNGDGWLPTILIGEERLTLGAVIDKGIARGVARAHAQHIRDASNGI